MPRVTKKVVRTKPQGESPITTSADRPADPAPAAPEYILTEARVREMSDEIDALGEQVITSRGRLHQRIQWSTRIRIAAERDAAELVLAPFFTEPAVTKDEILRMRDQIELLRAAESRFQQSRAERKDSSVEFRELAAEAAEHKEKLLRAFDLRFRDDPVGQKVIADIRVGEGDADLVQDVSDIVILCQDHGEYLASCPRGEAAAAKRLSEMSPRLAHLLGAKTLAVAGRPARRMRDGAYTLVMNTERRIRAAAQYWYDGTEKMKEYLAYSPPAGAKPEEEEEPAPPETPTVDNGAPA